jgi:heme/copper-type cytochrome/quinol oxidase subunit 3
MVSLVIVTTKAHQGAYESPRTAGGHDPIHLTTMYWHFLDVVWLVMFGLLLATR